MASLDELNPRENEIVKQLSLGLSDQAIADRLFLSLNTVKWYNRQIYGKLGVRTRTQAIARARETGLLKEKSLTPRLQRPQQLHFTNSFDGTRIAYAVVGSGPPLVKAATYMGHMNFDWESPVWGHWLAELIRNRTLVRYDERGTGMSERNVTDFSFEAWVRDLEAVADAVELDRFALFAMSHSGAVAVAYAARHPKRVSHLILHGAYARGWLIRDLTPTQREEEKLLMNLMRVGWGQANPAFRQVFAMQLFPEATTEELRALEEQMRLSASPENAVRLETEMHRVDVRSLAEQVQCPTLVFHSRQDAAVPFDEGVLLASLIPKARFVPLESKNHLLTEQEPAWKQFQLSFRSFIDD
ncbi:MAG: alpha/beta fold hydrolase [Chloroflexi bacterium]|nr:alpha/beta fold hydrolase [Chloroflexota bacterium]